jgi:hypothetical protein
MVLACVLGQVLLRSILESFHSVSNVFLISNDGYHFFLHLLIYILETSANLNVFSVFLDQAEHLLKHEVID